MSHTHTYIIFCGSQKTTLAVYNNLKKKCLTLVGKALPPKNILCILLWYMNRSVIRVCVSQLPKMLMYFLALRAIFVKLCIFAKKIPKIFRIPYEKVCAFNGLLIKILRGRRAYCQVENYLGQGDIFPRCLPLSAAGVGLRLTVLLLRYIVLVRQLHAPKRRRLSGLAKVFAFLSHPASQRKSN